MKTLSTNMDLYAKFHDQFLRDFPFAANEGILLAVSGGVDSMVLAHLCHSMGLRIAIAHCNFLLRGADADQDELHVKEWAETHQLPFFITQFDTATIAAEWKKSIQETARDLRYDWLRQIAQANGYRYIATAHQANDNAETL